MTTHRQNLIEQALKARHELQELDNVIDLSDCTEDERYRYDLVEENIDRLMREIGQDVLDEVEWERNAAGIARLKAFKEKQEAQKNEKAKEDFRLLVLCQMKGNMAMYELLKDR